MLARNGLSLACSVQDVPYPRAVSGVFCPVLEHGISEDYLRRSSRLRETTEHVKCLRDAQSWKAQTLPETANCLESCCARTTSSAADIQGLQSNQ